jgi:hypothetical protein
MAVSFQTSFAISKLFVLIFYPFVILFCFPPFGGFLFIADHRYPGQQTYLKGTARLTHCQIASGVGCEIRNAISDFDYIPRAGSVWPIIGALFTG